MSKPIFLAIAAASVAATLVLLHSLPEETVESAEHSRALEERWAIVADEWRRESHLEADLARTFRSTSHRESLVAELLEARVSLDHVRTEFRRINDESAGCWVSLRSANPGCSDEQCLDRQIRIYVRACQPGPEYQQAYERLVAQLGEPPCVTAGQP